MEESQTYFGLFSLPLAYALDESRLHRAWLVRQQEYHPDRHFNLPHPERARAVEQATAATAAINHAYQTLKDPFLRAVYLLELKSCPIDEQQTLADPDFLEQMMQLRTELNEMSGQGDAKALGEVLCRLEEARRDCIDRLGDLFAEKAYEQGEAGHLERIRQCALELKFHLRLLEQGRTHLQEMKQRCR